MYIVEMHHIYINCVKLYFRSLGSSHFFLSDFSPVQVGFFHNLIEIISNFFFPLETPAEFEGLIYCPFLAESAS